MLDRAALRFLGACVFKATNPHYSTDLCFASAEILLEGADRESFPDQHITPPARPDPWDAPSPIVRPRGAEVPA
ncbi:MAG: hypothetical protein AB7N73_16235 [Gemmatimonadales bacterium]